MTIPSSYASLQTTIGEQRERTDAAFASQLTTFIALAEAKLNRTLRVRLNKVDDATLTSSASSRLIALPSDFLDPIAVWLTTSSVRTLLRPYNAGTDSLSTTNGTPKAWAINGANIEFDCPLAASETFTIRYRKKLFDLATTSPNWLLTNHPDIYLYASLIEAADWENDDNGVLKYDARLKSAVAELERQESRHEARAQLTVDAALQPARTDFNYTAGF
jgi:hypothetical protein